MLAMKYVYGDYQDSSRHIMFVLVCFISAILAVKEYNIITQKEGIKRLRDYSTEKNNLLAEKNKMLTVTMNNEIRIATLSERNRIAREIHDNVGHMLSRAILQLGAIMTVYRKDTIYDNLVPIKYSLDTAMNNIRESVHDLHKDGFNVKETAESILSALGNYDIDPDFEAEIEALMEKKHYDMVFTVNYFALISNTCQKMGVKYVSWTCDNPLISMYHISVFNDCNYIFTFDKTNYLEFKEMGVKHIWYLPLAVDVDRIDMILQKSEDSVKYRGDIAFVGSLYERNSYDKIKNRLPEYLRGYFDAVMEAQLNISGANIVEPMLTTNILEQLQEYFQLEKSEGSFSDLGLIFQTTVLGFKIAEIERRRALIELSKHYRVNVYSNSDVSDLLRIQYCGSVDYWSEMPKVFRMSKINLNFTIPNIKSGIPLRIWDVLGCGGFLLTNYQAEIPYYFKEGEDLVCFDGLEDLCEKVGYYLEHEEERKRIAWNGYHKVREKHSYIERIHTILDTVAGEDAK